MNEQSDKPSFPSGSLTEQAFQMRQDEIWRAIQAGEIGPDSDAFAEFTELSTREGADTSLLTQLLDAGFGPGGIF